MRQLQRNFEVRIEVADNEDKRRQALQILIQLHNERFRAALGIRAADHVLDIGCGTGQTTREAALVASAGHALGVDIDAGMIARARELADREGVPNVRFEVGDAQQLPFAAATFERTLSLLVLIRPTKDGMINSSSDILNGRPSSSAIASARSTGTGSSRTRA